MCRPINLHRPIVWSIVTSGYVRLIKNKQNLKFGVLIISAIFQMLNSHTLVAAAELDRADVEQLHQSRKFEWMALA